MKVKLKIDREESLREKVEELSGENLLKCYQCGRCSGGCPSIASMDLIPNQVNRYIMLGLDEEVLNSKTIWACASCFTCSQRCPKGVNLPKIMESLRQIRIRKNVDIVSVDELTPKERMELPTIALVSCLRKMSS
ncbi:4Fe-4S dicluster domain-containing protein [bacterium]|nr:4Fe-4S dicluster domain-containing protein [bacterium]